MDNSTLYTSFIAGFSALVGSGITYKISNRKQDVTDFDSLIAAYKGIISDNKDVMDECRVRLDDLELTVKGLEKAIHRKDQEIQHLRNQLIIFESSHSDVPVPIWLKDTNGVMLFVNSEYEKKILMPLNKTSEDYIGETDFKIYPTDVAKEFRKHDRRVMTQKKPIRFKERWQNSDGDWYEGDILKYPRFLNRDTVIGIGGLIIDIKEVNEANKEL